MLQSFVLQNSSLNCKSTKPENVAHLVNVKGLHKLVIRTYFKHPIQYLACVTCKIRLISTKHCLI